MRRGLTAISRAFIPVAAALALCCALLLHPRALGATEMTLGVPPVFSAVETVNRFSPLAAYLTKQTGVVFRLAIPRSYKIHYIRSGLDRYDVFLMGGLEYLRLRDQYGPRIILGKISHDTASGQMGIFIVRRDNPVNNLRDLSGKAFAFGPQDSALGHLLPEKQLESRGVRVMGRYMSSFSNVAYGVLGGIFYAGAINWETFEKFQPLGLRVLADIARIPGDLLVASPRVPKDMADRIANILQDIGDSQEGRAILANISRRAVAIEPASITEIESDDIFGLRNK
ncbi:MAG: PhnD/SsuA/transferrin family substrate-binding protein [Deltaproteobacteria bacterium]|nr:PhnD/SsuA/transferrin family substrate-binding protein [Deltaproteobacteria bacterium]